MRVYYGQKFHSCLWTTFDNISIAQRLVASRPSIRNMAAELFLRKNYAAALIDGTLLTQCTLKSFIKLIESIQSWQACTEKR